MRRCGLLELALVGVLSACASAPPPLIEPGLSSEDTAEAAQRILDEQGDEGLALLQRFSDDSPFLYFDASYPVLAVFVPQTRWLHLHIVGPGEQGSMFSGVQHVREDTAVERLLGLPRDDGGFAFVMLGADRDRHFTFVINGPGGPTLAYFVYATTEQVKEWEAQGEHPGPFDLYGRHAAAK